MWLHRGPTSPWACVGGRRPISFALMTDKQIAVETLGRLPEAASLAEITEELQVVAAIRRGQADVAAGRARSHEDVKRLLASWTEQWTTKSRASS